SRRPAPPRPGAAPDSGSRRCPPPAAPPGRWCPRPGTAAGPLRATRAPRERWRRSAPPARRPAARAGPGRRGSCRKRWGPSRAARGPVRAGRWRSGRSAGGRRWRGCRARRRSLRSGRASCGLLGSSRSVRCGGRGPLFAAVRTAPVREVGQSVSMSDVTTRALRLLALLQSRAVWTGPELADEMGVTTRTVRRDVDRLRQLGYPVLTSAGHGGGYQLGAGQALPPLLLSSSEAVAVAVGLRLAASSGVDGLDEEALRALAALDRILPATVRAEVAAISAATGVITRPAAGIRSEVLMRLATAVRDGVRVRVDYE